NCLSIFLCYHVFISRLQYFFFFFNDTPPTEIYTLSLHDALPISNVRTGDHVTLDEVEVAVRHPPIADWERQKVRNDDSIVLELRDRKSTRLNSSHLVISYAVFCLKKKKLNKNNI